MDSPATKRSRRSGDSNGAQDEKSLKSAVFFPGLYVLVSLVLLSFTDLTAMLMMNHLLMTD